MQKLCVNTNWLTFEINIINVLIIRIVSYIILTQALRIKQSRFCRLIDPDFNWMVKIVILHFYNSIHSAHLPIEIHSPSKLCI